MKYYAHTAIDADDRQLPAPHWQPLAEHLRNVAAIAGQFAAPLDLAAEAEAVARLDGSHDYLL